MDWRIARRSNMTITFTIGIWAIPLIITILSFVIALIINWVEEDYWGMLGPMSIIFGIAASVFSWITWGLIVIFTK